MAKQQTEEDASLAGFFRAREDVTPVPRFPADSYLALLPAALYEAHLMPLLRTTLFTPQALNMSWSNGCRDGSPIVLERAVVDYADEREGTVVRLYSLDSGKILWRNKMSVARASTLLLCATADGYVCASLWRATSVLVIYKPPQQTPVAAVSLPNDSNIRHMGTVGNRVVVIDDTAVLYDLSASHLELVRVGQLPVTRDWYGLNGMHSDIIGDVLFMDSQPMWTVCLLDKKSEGDRIVMLARPTSRHFALSVELVGSLLFVCTHPEVLVYDLQLEKASIVRRVPRREQDEAETSAFVSLQRVVGGGIAALQSLLAQASHVNFVWQGTLHLLSDAGEALGAYNITVPMTRMRAAVWCFDGGWLVIGDAFGFIWWVDVIKGKRVSIQHVSDSPIHSIRGVNGKVLIRMGNVLKLFELGKRLPLIDEASKYQADPRITVHL